MNTNGYYRAVVCKAPGPPEALALERLPREPLVPGNARVRLNFCGVNFPDLLVIEGKYQYKPTLPFVPGVEAAGIVIEVAADVHTVRPGDHVMAMMRTGGYAEEAVIASESLFRLPNGFSLKEGATFLVAHTTAYHALVTRAGLAPRQTLLVIGAGGGVGLAAVELGRHLGAHVLAAASSRQKLDTALACGADVAIDYAQESLPETVAAVTGKQGADVIFDPTGHDQDTTLRCLAFGGKILLIGFASGKIPNYAANRILLKGSTILGVRAGEAGRRSPTVRKREIAALLSLANAGVLRPKVTAIHPLEDYATAMRALISRNAIGRIVLDTMSDGGGM
jgi:NADPH2:quinone reductase